MSRKLHHVGHNNGLLLGGRGAAHTLSKFNQLASGLAVEWSKQQGLFLVHGRICSRDDHLTTEERRRLYRGGEGGEFIIADIETGPVHGRGWRGEGCVGMPEERGDIGEVARMVLVP